MFLPFPIPYSTAHVSAAPLLSGAAVSARRARCAHCRLEAPGARSSNAAAAGAALHLPRLVRAGGAQLGGAALAAGHGLGLSHLLLLGSYVTGCTAIAHIFCMFLRWRAASRFVNVLALALCLCLFLSGPPAILSHRPTFPLPHPVAALLPAHIHIVLTNTHPLTLASRQTRRTRRSSSTR